MYWDYLGCLDWVYHQYCQLVWELVHDFKQKEGQKTARLQYQPQLNPDIPPKIQQISLIQPLTHHKPNLQTGNPSQNPITNRSKTPLTAKIHAGRSIDRITRTIHGIGVAAWGKGNFCAQFAVVPWVLAAVYPGVQFWELLWEWWGEGE